MTQTEPGSDAGTTPPMDNLTKSATPPPPSAWSAKAAPAGASRGLGRLTNWLTLRDRMQATKCRLDSVPQFTRMSVSRARHALELADRLLDPIDPLRTGPAHDLALSTYREAAFWALHARCPDHSTLAAQWQAAPAEMLESAAGGSDELDRARHALVERSFVETAALDWESQKKDADAAKLLVHGLLESLDGPERQLRRLRASIVIRIAVVAILAALAIFASISGIRQAMQRPDLAQGKSWRTSSRYADFDPVTKVSGGHTTKLLFHTEEEASPWFELDLGATMRFSRVEVKNRSDCCPGRAIPLVVEVSKDQSSWEQVAQTDEEFSSWTAKFTAREARYVRLRVNRRSFLHLEEVNVRLD